MTTTPDPSWHYIVSPAVVNFVPEHRHCWACGKVVPEDRDFCADHPPEPLKADPELTKEPNRNSE